MQYYMLLAPSTIEEPILFQLIIAQSKSLFLVVLLELTHASWWIWWKPVTSTGQITGR